MLFVGGAAERLPAAEPAAPKKVYVLPIRDDIMPPMLYLVRRGVKEAMEAKADLLVLDMDTDGGRVDTTLEIIKIIDKFRGQTVTFVNAKAFSAGAFISVATQKIYMTPQSVIGAAAPIMLSPGGTGVEKMPDTVEVKTISAIKGLVTAQAEKNGHDVEVIEAMIDKTTELKRVEYAADTDGNFVVTKTNVINTAGRILTLTDIRAAKAYGNPPKPLLSAGTVKDLDELLKKLGFADAKVTKIEPLGLEKVGTWLDAIGPLLLIIGIAGIYIEMKTPGFGLPGIVGICALVVYFLGGYVSGLAGKEQLVLLMTIFVVGLALVVVELFFLPGTIVIGMTGATLMLIALVMAYVDTYPGLPQMPTLPQLELPLRNLFITFLGSIVVIWLLSLWLPKTFVYSALVSQSASGVVSVVDRKERQAALLGQEGVTTSKLRPGGKAQFGDQILDVITQGEMIDKGQRVRIIGHSASEAVVEAVG